MKSLKAANVMVMDFTSVSPQFCTFTTVVICNFFFLWSW